jgi:hypothetical protein
MKIRSWLFASFLVLVFGSIAARATTYRILVWEYNYRALDHIDEEGRYFSEGAGVNRIALKDVTPYEVFSINSDEGFDQQEYITPYVADYVYSSYAYFYKCCSDYQALTWIMSYGCGWAMPEAYNSLPGVFPYYSAFAAIGSTLGFGPFSGVQSPSFDHDAYVY